MGVIAEEIPRGCQGLFTPVSLGYPLSVFKRANVAVVPGYADVRASAVMTDDNNDDVDDGHFDDTLSEILGTSSRVATSPDLDLTFGAVDVNVDRACTSLLSPFSHLP